MSIHHVLEQFVKDNNGIGYKKFDFYLEAMSEASEQDLFEFEQLMTAAIDERDVGDFYGITLKVAHATRRMCEAYAVKCYPDQWMLTENQTINGNVRLVADNPNQEHIDADKKETARDFAAAHHDALGART